MGGRHHHVASAVLEQRLGSFRDRAAGVDHVVDHDAQPVAHIADNLEHLDLVGHIRVTSFVDDGQRAAAEHVGPPLRDPHSTCIRRNHGDGRHVVVRLDMLGQEGKREQVVDRAVEESLDLRGVQVHGHDAVGPGATEQVHHHASSDGLPAAVLLVLPGVAEEGGDHRDAFGRRAFGGVDHDQLLHDPLVDRRRVALQDEDVTAAHRLLITHEDLAVGEVVCRDGAQFHPQLAGDLGGKFRM